MPRTASRREGRVLRADPNQELGAKRHHAVVARVREIAGAMATYGHPVDGLVPHPSAVQRKGIAEETRAKVQAPFARWATTHESHHVDVNGSTLRAVNPGKPRKTEEEKQLGKNQKWRL